MNVDLSSNSEDEDVKSVSSAYSARLESYTQNLMGKVGAMESLGLRRLLAKSGKLLIRYFKFEMGFEHPESMLDAHDILDLYKLAARIRQVEMALGRILIRGMDLESSDEERDDLAARVGLELVWEFHVELVRAQNRQLEMWKAGDWDGLYKARAIPLEEFRGLKYHFPHGNPRPTALSG